MYTDKYSNPSFIDWGRQFRIDPKAKEEWIEALLSEAYKDKQGKSVLATPDGNFCCLGVWCDLKDLPSQFRTKEYPSPEGSGKYITDQVRTFFNSYEEIETGSAGTIAYIPSDRGIPTHFNDGFPGMPFTGGKVLWRSWTQYDDGTMGVYQPFSLPHLNDNGFTFAQIADVIRYFL